MSEHTTTPDVDDGKPPGHIVHVILATHIHRDDDGHPQQSEKILESEGWFADPAAAAVRRDELNDRLRALYDVTMARQARERDTKIRRIEAANAEAAVLRASGIDKADQPAPEPFEPVPFEGFVPSGSYTRYAVVEILRSDHDLLTQAG